MTRLAAAQTNLFSPRRNVTMSVQDRHGGFGPHLAIQREGAGPSSPAAPNLIRGVVSSPGEPLDPRLRAVMEPQLGYDFSGVRVHTDTPAAQSAQAIAANAYTAGDHIVFGAGRFDPWSASGQRLVAHELAHVIQQADGPVAGRAIDGDVSLSTPDDPFERAAATLSRYAMQTDAAAGSVRGPVAPLPLRSPGPGPLAVQRDWTSAGSIAGIIGAALAGAALIVAALAWLKPKNPNATAQGVAMQPNPFTFQATGTAPSTPEEKKKYQSAQEGPPRVNKVLELKTDDDNDTSFNLQRSTDGSSIIGASIIPGETKGYQGGYNSSIAAVNFSAMQTYPPPADASAAASQPAPAAPSATPAATATPVANDGGAGGASSTPAAPAAPAPQIAREIIHFSGTNARSGEPTQTFAGEVLVTGDDQVTCTRCDVLNGIGYAEHSGAMGLVSYEKKAPPRASLVGPGSSSPEEDPGPHLPSLKDILPFNKPMTGGGA
jgi:Domain of unknown function (DUF4157)